MKVIALSVRDIFLKIAIRAKKSLQSCQLVRQVKLPKFPERRAHKETLKRR